MLANWLSMRKIKDDLRLCRGRVCHEIPKRRVDQVMGKGSMIPTLSSDSHGLSKANYIFWTHSV